MAINLHWPFERVAEQLEEGLIQYSTIISSAGTRIHPTNAQTPQMPSTD